MLSPQMRPSGFPNPLAITQHESRTTKHSFQVQDRFDETRGPNLGKKLGTRGKELHPLLYLPTCCSISIQERELTQSLLLSSLHASFRLAYVT